MSNDSHKRTDPAEVRNGAGSEGSKDLSASPPLNPNGGESVKRGKFFAAVLGTDSGYLCLAKKTPGTNNLEQKFFWYPGELDDALAWIDKYVARFDLYFCPHLLSRKARNKDAVTETVPLLWADLDPCHPSKCKVAPSVAWETSPKRYQALWYLEKSIDKWDAEALSHAIAIAHKEDGCDQGGWDLTQLLRIPFTWNFKPGYRRNGDQAPDATRRLPASRLRRLQRAAGRRSGHRG
jgi:hypothetical protein